MKTEQAATFNLDEVRPKILVMGNGLTYGTSVSWPELIRKVSRDNVDVSRYEETNSDGRIRFVVPNTVLTLATSVTKDQERHRKYVDALKKESYPDNTNIRELLDLPFDAVLTTNYTYELEATLNARYPGLTSASKRNYAATTGKEADAKYLLHTFNRIKAGHPDIWHIHGELRCPSSMILSHDEYARYIHRILMHNEKCGNSYQNHRQDLRFESWVDYFLLGDVYMLGLGMDFSEFDLWWLLGRRLREKAGCGQIVFYEPYQSTNRTKQFALEDCGVTVETCGINLDAGDSYDAFYKAAIHDIAERMKTNKR